jgi:hypothetical protein
MVLLAAATSGLIIDRSIYNNCKSGFAASGPWPKKKGETSILRWAIGGVGAPWTVEDLDHTGRSYRVPSAPPA